MEAAILEKVIFASFPDLKGNFFAALMPKKNDGIDCTLLFKKELNSEIIDKITNFIRALNINITNIQFIFAKQSILTPAMLQTLIKINQPIDLQAINEKLEQNSVYFGKQLLNNMLDNLRIEGKIIWSKNFYSTTEDALDRIPHGNYRGSSDVKRVLELWKNK